MRQLVVIVMFWTPVFAAFIDPFFGILGYKLGSIIRPEQLMWGDMSAAGRIFLALQASILFSWFMHKDELNPEDTPLPFQMKILWLVAIEMTIVTFGFAIDQQWSWRWTSGFWKMTLLCFLMVKSFNNAKKLELYYALSLVWSTLLAIWGIQQKLGGNTRLEGLGGVQLPDSNAIAALYVLHFPMTYYTLFSRKKWIKTWVGIPSFIIMGIFILFTDSRGAFLGMAASMMWIFMRAKGGQKIKMLATLVLLVPLLLIIVNALIPGFFDEYIDRLATITGEKDELTGEVEYEGSASGRMAMWRGAWHIYTHHHEYWLFGVGMHCYARMYYDYHIDELADVLSEEDYMHVLYGGKGGKDMHNTYLNVLLGGGAVTFLTWLFLIIYSWIQVHNIPKKYPRIVDGVDIHNYAKGIEVGIIGWAVCMVVGTREFIDFFYWYLIMGGIIANLGKAKLRREALGKEDEEYIPTNVRQPAAHVSTY